MGNTQEQRGRRSAHTEPVTEQHARTLSVFSKGTRDDAIPAKLIREAGPPLLVERTRMRIALAKLAALSDDTATRMDSVDDARAFLRALAIDAKLALGESVPA